MDAGLRRLRTLVGFTHLDPWELVSSGWAARAFGGMLLCQLPCFIQCVRTAKAMNLAPEKIGMDAETGFVLHRIAILASMASMLALFGQYALHGLVVVAQVLGAGSEIMRDRYIGYLMESRTPASGRGASTAGVRTRRKRR